MTSGIIGVIASNVDVVASILNYMEIDVSDAIDVLSIAEDAGIDEEGISRLRSSIFHIDTRDSDILVEDGALFPNVRIISLVVPLRISMILLKKIIDSYKNLRIINRNIVSSEYDEDEDDVRDDVSDLFRLLYERKITVDIMIRGMYAYPITIDDGYCVDYDQDMGEPLLMYSIMSAVRLGRSVDVSNLISYQLTMDKHLWMGDLTNDVTIVRAYEGELPLVANYPNVRDLEYLGDEPPIEIERMYPRIEVLRNVLVDSYDDLPINPKNLRVVESTNGTLYYHNGDWYTWRREVDDEVIVHRAIRERDVEPTYEQDVDTIKVLIVEPLSNYSILESMPNLVSISVIPKIDVLSSIEKDAHSVYQKIVNETIRYTG